MKKILFGIILLINVMPSFAGQKCLSIKLLNATKNTVQFSTDVNPNYRSQVKYGEAFVLPRKIITACFGKNCNVLITPLDEMNKTKKIYGVPKGSLIVYYGPKNYQLYKANVLCPK